MHTLFTNEVTAKGVWYILFVSYFIAQFLTDMLLKLIDKHLIKLLIYKHILTDRFLTTDFYHLSCVCIKDAHRYMES